ncbi:hypothetical protein EDB84DRAFT_1625835 [Lactarius hengduanensis]|nr:hypothetical protein EDB84DRAFT_1625835 [Lactarius hengduanensis]
MGGSELDSDDAAAHINALELDFVPAFAAPDSPPPRPPRSPRRPSSPRIAPPPLPVVEGDNALTGGSLSSIDEPPRPDRSRVTSPAVDNADEFDFEAFYTSYMDDNHLSENLAASVAISASSPTDHGGNEQAPHDDVSVYLRSPYAPIFLQNAFEMPRDPDKVAPATSRPITRQHHRAKAAVTTPRPNTNAKATRNSDRQTRCAQTRSPPALVGICPTRDRGQTNTTTANRIHAWLARIVYEPPPRLDSQRAPATRNPVADERADHALRDYGVPASCRGAASKCMRWHL